MVQKPTIAAFEGDSESLSIKKVEELYHYSRYVFDGEIERIKRIDTKISRYLAGSLVLLGFSATWLCRILEQWSLLLCFIDYLALVSAVLSIVFLGIATLSFLILLRFVPVYALPGGEDQLRLLYGYAYIRVLATLSLFTMEAASKNESISQRKIEKTRVGYQCLKLGIVFTVVAFLGYMCKVVWG